MATVPSIDALSSDDREIVVSSLKLKLASLERSARSESNPAIAKLRAADALAVSALIRRFS